MHIFGRMNGSHEMLGPMCAHTCCMFSVAALQDGEGRSCERSIWKNMYVLLTTSTPLSLGSCSVVSYAQLWKVSQLMSSCWQTQLWPSFFCIPGSSVLHTISRSHSLWTTKENWRKNGHIQEHLIALNARANNMHGKKKPYSFSHCVSFDHPNRYTFIIRLHINLPGLPTCRIVQILRPVQYTIGN